LCWWLLGNSLESSWKFHQLQLTWTAKTAKTAVIATNAFILRLLEVFLVVALTVKLMWS
jgi:hypothetical protein